MGVEVERKDFRFPEARLDRNLTEMAMENPQNPGDGVGM